MTGTPDISAVRAKRLTFAAAVVLAVGCGLFIAGLVMMSGPGGAPENTPQPSANNVGDPPSNTPESPENRLPSTPEQLAAAGTYLVEANRCNFCHRTEAPDKAPHFRDNCQQCHQFEDRHEYLAPPLKHIAERRPAEWIRRYLRYPYPIRTNSPSRMPDLGLSARDVEVLTRYLESLAAERIAGLSPVEVTREASPSRLRQISGNRLMFSFNCVNCHSLGDHKVRIQFGEDGKPVFQPNSIFAPDLTDAWTRLRPEWAIAAIQDPIHWMPWAGMPDHGDLTEDDAKNIVWYLFNHHKARTQPVEYQQVAEIIQRRCVHCHYGPGNADPHGLKEGGAGWIETWGGAARQLDLTSVDGMFKGALDDLGVRRPAVVPFARNSPLLMHLRVKAPLMPFGAGPIPEEEYRLIEAWIMQGAEGQSGGSD